MTSGEGQRQQTAVKLKETPDSLLQMKVEGGAGEKRMEDHTVKGYSANCGKLRELDVRFVTIKNTSSV